MKQILDGVYLSPIITGRRFADGRPKELKHSLDLFVPCVSTKALHWSVPGHALNQKSGNRFCMSTVIRVFRHFIAHLFKNAYNSFVRAMGRLVFGDPVLVVLRYLRPVLEYALRVVMDAATVVRFQSYTA